MSSTAAAGSLATAAAASRILRGLPRRASLSSALNADDNTSTLSRRLHPIYNAIANNNTVTASTASHVAPAGG
eukprot:CAMPEP_0197601402 /NCGR_PEP_ID=MMETSP1326-20131121/35229_1 /TAXON_ID=1155430 /ORGANISM="Genus nov. species nov., Strain RCC2288" /LENGTH=72 /DNA_ID=CAMNT_0043168629 /DNA_START=8 /DNA_END=223 /DNA_ORIENTATION=+